METNNGSTRISTLDGMRGIAVLAVFFYHTLAIPARGDLGVDVFFVLSGFLISSQIFSEIERTGTVSMTAFYWRRCVRLLPAYGVMCVLFESIAFCFPSVATHASPVDLLKFLFMANYYWQQNVHPYPIISHVWTLSTEWQFYLAWPFLLLVAAKMRLRRRTMLALVGTAIVADWIARLCGHGALRVDGLLLGACVALVKDHPMVRHQIHRIAEPAFVVCTAVIVLLTFHAVPLAATQDPTIVAAAAALLVLVVCTGPTRMMDVALGNGVFRYFGKISYGLYLYHFPVVGAMYLGGFTGPKMLVAGMLVAIPLADFSFRFIESPIMKMRAKQKETFIESKAEVRS